MSNDYKDTLNLPKTKFPMKANLPQREPAMLKLWQDLDLYNVLQQRNCDKPKFILNDGPPYANGNIHIGHAANKTLKDIICKAKLLGGYQVPFVPGWDCHGLPIELNVEKKHGKPGHKIDAKTFRAKCREYAGKQYKIQRESFMRLGILADWHKPYLTMDYKFEADVMRSLATIIKNGYLVKGDKPVHWCIDCGSALAEAEVEYKDKTSTAIEVCYPVGDAQDVSNIFKGDFGTGRISVVIWTTTPWTLPASMAVTVHAELEYSLVQHQDQRFIMARELTPENYKILATCRGAELEQLKLQHPLYARQVPVILGEHVTVDAGTGCVHTAPAHGLEDHIVCNKYGIETYNPVGSNGCYLDDTEIFAGLHVFKANSAVIEVLQKQNNLLSQMDLEHSYPHCWRHKIPLIFRATTQWFMSMKQNNLRAKVLQAIKHVAWHPSWGEERMVKMVENRPDWCLSRQRTWGVPMGLIIDKQTGELHPNMPELLAKVAAKVEKSGVDAWHELDLAELISDSAKFEKTKDTLDVWFDSGVVHSCVLDARDGLNSPADLYLEGSDQYRGWFNSSMFTSMAMKKQAPYKQVLTHGFTVDAKGHKMSKSLGNVVAPEKVINSLGADVLRLWVAATDYTREMHVSDEILKRTSDAYRRLRNTAKFLLSNLDEFDPSQHMVPAANMLALDKWILVKTQELQNEIIAAYDDYNFHLIYQKIHNFCGSELGGFYLDIIKDRQYTCRADGLPRRSSQTAMYHIIECLCRWLAPILSFTAEEIWQHMPGERAESIFFSSWYKDIPELSLELDDAYWQQVIAVRDEVNKALEQKRAEGVLGSGLEAEVELHCDPELFNLLTKLGTELKFVLITSSAELKKITTDEKLKLVIKNSMHKKCVRCWHRVPEVVDICARCEVNINGAGEVRHYA